MNTILKEQDVNYFLDEIDNIFPNFVAGVVTDSNGFLIATKIPKNFHIHENDLALSAVVNKQDFIKGTNYLKIRRDLDKAKKIKLFLLLQKSSKYFHRFKVFKKIVETQALF